MKNFTLSILPELLDETGLSMQEIVDRLIYTANRLCYMKDDPFSEDDKGATIEEWAEGFDFTAVHFVTLALPLLPMDVIKDISESRIKGFGDCRACGGHESTEKDDWQKEITYTCEDCGEYWVIN